MYWKRPALLWFRAGPPRDVYGRLREKHLLHKRESPPGRRIGLKAGASDPDWSVMLGEPVVEVNENSLENSKEYRSSIVQTMRQHLQLEAKAKVLHKLGVLMNLSWRTNEQPNLHEVGTLSGSLENTPKDQLDIALAGVGLIENSMSATVRNLKPGSPIPRYIRGLADFLDWLHSKGIMQNPSQLSILLRDKSQLGQKSPR